MSSSYKKMRAMAFGVTLAAGAASYSFAQSFSAQQILVDGNFRIETATVISYSGLVAGQVYSAADIAQAYQNLSDTGLFESIEIIPDGGRLVIDVEEYPTVNEVAIEGNKRLKNAVLEPLLGTKSRRVFDRQQVLEDAQAIADAYSQSGRLAAQVTPKFINRNDNRVDVVFEVFEGSLTEIEKIAFIGNRAYPDKRLRRVVASKQAGTLRQLIRSDTFVADRVAYDSQLLSDFYKKRGYIDFKVLSVDRTLAKDRDGFFLSYHVQEGAQFEFGDISVASELSEIDVANFEPWVDTKSGKTYSPFSIDRDVERLESQALRLGHEFVRIQPRLSRRNEELKLDVVYDIVRTPRVFIERINIKGNTGTLDRVIRRQFDAVEGDPFNDRLIRQAVDRIRAMGFFETVEANIRNGSAPDQRIVEIEVVEAPTGSLSFGGTYSTNDGVGALISYSERNFLGRGQTLKVDLTTAGDQREYGLTFVEPAFLARDVSLGLSARQFTSNNATGSYDVASTTLQASLGFQVSETGSLSTRVGLDTTEITDASAASVGQLISAEARRGSLSNPTLGYTYSYDSRRTGLNPNSGFVVSFAQDLGLGSDAQYVKSEFKSRAQTQVIGETVTLSAAFEAGNITYNGDEKSRVTERFALRSSQMRGFQNGGIGPRERDGAGIDEALGGTNYAVARFEARFPLGLPDEYGIDGGLFYDIGSLWGLDATNTNGNVLYDDVSWRQSAGASIFWDTPIGPLRFNFISPLVTEEFDKDQSFEFTISARF